MAQSAVNELPVQDLARAIARELRREFSPLPALDVLNDVQAVETTITVGPILIDVLGHEALLDEVPVDLKPREFALLVFLARNAGRVFTRQQLLDVVWPEDTICKVDNDRTVDVHVCRIRRKLGAGARLLRTVAGVGYKVEAVKAPP